MWVVQSLQRRHLSARRVSKERREMARLAPLLLFELDGRQHPVPDVLLFRVVEHLNAVRPPFGAGLPGSGVPNPIPHEVRL